jgi:hypothetical protein
MAANYPNRSSDDEKASAIRSIRRRTRRGCACVAGSHLYVASLNKILNSLVAPIGQRRTALRTRPLPPQVRRSDHVSLILVVHDESDVEMLFRQQFRRELRAGRFRMDFALSADRALQRMWTLGGFTPSAVIRHAISTPIDTLGWTQDFSERIRSDARRQP